MAHFIEGLDRQQMMLLPEYLDDYVDENDRAIDAFVDFLDLTALGFNTRQSAIRKTFTSNLTRHGR